MSIRTSRTVAGIILVAIVVAIFWYMKRDSKYVSITSFQECVDAGYPVLESFPEQCRTPDGSTFVRPTATSAPQVMSFPNGNEDRIRVANAPINETIASPLVITGEARGNWYFEASFPVELRDGNGILIAQEPAQAQGEWMTVEFVPFSVTLEFTKPRTATGTLILRNDNPSGLPENDRWISIPVRF